MQALHFALLHEPPQQRSTRRQLALLFLPWEAVKVGSSQNSRRPACTFIGRMGRTGRITDLRKLRPGLFI